MQILFILAILPIVALCCFIYYKDTNKEPKKLLALIFFLGFVSVFPILVCELVFDYFFPTPQGTGFSGFIPTFASVFFGVALFEEGFKWLIAKFLGYNNKEFDEVFDIIVYSVFASLGFACFENIMYVFTSGFTTALFRSVTSIPGHTCFAISMGYFFAKAKVGQINGNHDIYVKNTVLSIVVPMIIHTLYDTFIFIMNAQTFQDLAVQYIPFIVFYVGMVIVCFITVDKTAKVQKNLSVNLANGNIARNNQGVLYYNYKNVPAPIVPVSNVEVDVTVPLPADYNSVSSGTNNGVYANQTVSTSSPAAVRPSVVTPQPNSAIPDLSFCPICGKPSKGLNYCGRCGFKLK